MCHFKFVDKLSTIVVDNPNTSLKNHKQIPFVHISVTTEISPPFPRRTHKPCYLIACLSKKEVGGYYI